MVNSNEYMNEYMKKRWEIRRLKAIEYLGGKCVICGSVDSLEFDHKNPETKSFTIARASSFSESRFWEEINKCHLLCRTHHMIKSSSESSLKNRGERNGQAKMKDDIVIELRKEYKKKLFDLDIKAKELGVHKRTLKNALDGKTYKHLIG